MNHILFDHITANYCEVYYNDMLIYTETDDPAEHMTKLTAFLYTLREQELLIKGWVRWFPVIALGGGA